MLLTWLWYTVEIWTSFLKKSVCSSVGQMCNIEIWLNYSSIAWTCNLFCFKSNFGIWIMNIRKQSMSIRRRRQCRYDVDADADVRVDSTSFDFGRKKVIIFLTWNRSFKEKMTKRVETAKNSVFSFFLGTPSFNSPNLWGSQALVPEYP